MRRRKRRQTPHWNRFDICSAWYVYAINYHNGQSSKEYRIFGRLVNMLYSPGQLLQARLVNGLSDNAKLIYRNLVDGSHIRP